MLFTGIFTTAYLLKFVSGYGNPGACSGTCTNTHDPSIIRRDDGTYFRFSSNGDIAIHTAPSLEGPWTYACPMLPDGSSINLPGNNDLWAPDVSKVGDLYYIYYAVSTFGSQDSAIGLATSDSMECDTFEDHGSTGVASSSSDNYNAIDANLFLDGSTYHLNFGSFWSDIFQIEMAKDPRTVASGATNVQLSFDPAGMNPEEGSYMAAHCGYYYLFYSHGICCGYDQSRPAQGQEYMIKVCRSSSVSGPFVDASGESCTSGGGTVVLKSHDFVYGPGGQGVYNDPIHGWVLYYHYVDTRVGYADGDKQFGWNKISWVDDWPTV